MSHAFNLEKETVPQAGAGTAEDTSIQAAPDIRVVGETYRTVGDYTSAKPVVRARNVDVFYGDNHAIQNVSLDVGKNEVISLIGPSGCGKSTFIRCLNRMNDTIESARVHGEILLDGEDIYSRHMDVVMLRARVGIVFQKPNPFPKSVFDNVAYGPRIHGLARHREELDKIVRFEPGKGGAVVGGQGPIGGARYGAVRRTAAAAVHCKDHRRKPGGHPDG